MVNQCEDRHVFVTTPEMGLPEDYQEGEKWPGLASSLADLYMHYRRGVAKLDVIPTTVISATPTVFASQELVEPANAQVQLDALSSAFPQIHPSSPASSGPVDPADAQVQAAMSRTQYQLTLEEGKLWEKLAGPDEAVDHDESPTDSILASLREKSSFMVQSYHRRNNPPTETTYEESKNILRAMGVPCIESTGPYEAEALASALVLNGCADYVASEDTVRFNFSFFLHACLLEFSTDLISSTLTGRSHLRRTSHPQHHEQRQSPPAHLRLRSAIRAPPRRSRPD
jgi:hypothetical protein